MFFFLNNIVLYFEILFHLLTQRRFVSGRCVREDLQTKINIIILSCIRFFSHKRSKHSLLTYKAVLLMLISLCFVPIVGVPRHQLVAYKATFGTHFSVVCFYYRLLLLMQFGMLETNKWNELPLALPILTSIIVLSWIFRVRLWSLKESLGTACRGGFLLYSTIETTKRAKQNMRLNYRFVIFFNLF